MINKQTGTSARGDARENDSETINFEAMFPVVNVASILLEDEFMQYEPLTENQKRVKKSIVTAKTHGLKNFRRPACEPSFSSDGRNITYEKGKEPAVGRSPLWWDSVCKKFMQEKNSRLGTQIHYGVFLGIIIKYLVEEKKYSVSDAWYVVCNYSNEIGVYGKFCDGVHEFEKTGSNRIDRWYDVANTYKILKAESYGFMLAGTTYDGVSKTDSLATIYGVYHSDLDYFSSTGWMIMDV